MAGDTGTTGNTVRKFKSHPAGNLTRATVPSKKIGKKIVFALEISGPT